MNEIIQKLQELKQQLLSGQIDNVAYRSAATPLIRRVRGTTPNLNVNLFEFSPDFLDNALASQDKQEFVQRMQQVGGLAQAGVDITQAAMAYDQIKTANQAARQSVMPSLPQVPGPNQQLSEQLYDAQRRANDVGYAVNPAVQQLNQGYTQALGQAQAGSGGQASNYQAFANLANQQRMQAALGLVPQAQQARMQNQEQVNNLLGQRMQEQQNMFSNQMNQYQYPYEQFNLQQQAIGAIGSQGRTRAFDVISRLPEYLNYLPLMRIQTIPYKKPQEIQTL
jgi:hypothetical protein